MPPAALWPGYDNRLYDNDFRGLSFIRNGLRRACEAQTVARVPRFCGIPTVLLQKKKDRPLRSRSFFISGSSYLPSPGTYGPHQSPEHTAKPP
jgi:hypothetical protein